MSRLAGFGNLLFTRYRFAALVVLAGAVIYSLTYWLNHELFLKIEFNQRVNWFFIPSGVRLILVLLLDHLGAVGIVLGSMVIEWIYYANDVNLASLVSPLISGLAPLLSKFTMKRWFDVGQNLERLTAKVLTQYALVFAFFSATLHQIWFAIQEERAFDVLAWVPMFTGDVMGSLVVLCLFWVAIRARRALAN